MLNKICTSQNPQQQKIKQYNDTPVARDILINKSAERRQFIVKPFHQRFTIKYAD